jgi:predicted transcriptional regulator
MSNFNPGALSALHRQLRNECLKMDDVALLAHLATGSGSTYTAMSAATGLNAFTIRRYIAQLVKMGHVTATRNKEAVIALTDSGRAALERLLVPFLSHE